MQQLAIIGLTLLGLRITAPACSFRNAQLLQPPATVAHTPWELLSIRPPLTVAHSAPAKALVGSRDTHWITVDSVTRASLTVDPGERRAFDRAWIREEIGLGRQVRAFAVEARDVRGRQRIAEGTTIGYKHLPCFKEVAASRVRLAILDSRVCPAISEFGLSEASPRTESPDQAATGDAAGNMVADLPAWEDEPGR